MQLSYWRQYLLLLVFRFHLAVPFLEVHLRSYSWKHRWKKKKTHRERLELLHQRKRVRLNEPTPSVLCPGAVGDADAGGSFQRFRGAAGCMAGGGKARGNQRKRTHEHTFFASTLSACRTHQSLRRLEEQCDALMVSTASWWGWRWVFLGLMSVLCSCKAWIHSSGAQPDTPPPFG